MTDELQRYRNVFLDRYTSSDSFRSETIDITVDGETLPIEVRETSIRDMSSMFIPDDLIAEVGAETARQIVLVMRCSFIPGSDQRIWQPPEPDQENSDLDALLDAPMDGRGPIGRIYEAINYVHGYRTDPPRGIQDPRLEEIAEICAHGQALAEDHDEQLDNGEIAELFERVKLYAKSIDHGDDAGKEIAR